MRIAILSLQHMKKCTLKGPLKKCSEKLEEDTEINVINLEDIIVQYDEKGVNFYFEKENLLEYDAFLIRVDLSVQKELLFLIASTLKNEGKVVVNESYCGLGSMSDKLSFLSVAKEFDIHHPKTFFVRSYDKLEEILDKMQFPFIVKDHQGWQGSSVEKIEKKENLEYLKDAFPKNGLLIQEYIPIKSDIRVLVVGYTVIGAMERFSTSDDFRTNISLGGEAKKIELTEEMKTLAERISKETRNDILGVDFIFKDDKLLVLEIEECPGVKGFRMATGINVSDKIFEYIYKKVK
ncbi:MAG: RimK family alpha-L-glutamate ligase [Candidatus Moranbacteria bacterium]|nr:RimK family alpha-L-glutamate ligase [Candidatus Moranbacteria bacterium]